MNKILGDKIHQKEEYQAVGPQGVETRYSDSVGKDPVACFVSGKGSGHYVSQ